MRRIIEIILIIVLSLLTCVIANNDYARGKIIRSNGEYVTILDENGNYWEYKANYSIDTKVKIRLCNFGTVEKFDDIVTKVTVIK